MEEHKQTLTRLIEVVWNNRNPDEASSVFCADAVLHFNGPRQFGGHDYVGVSKICEDYIVPFQEGFPDLKHEIQSCNYFDQGAVMRFTGTGTNSGPLYDTKPTNKPLIYHGVAVFRFERGLVAEVWTNSNFSSQFSSD